MIRCRHCVGCSELTFAVETELSVANQFLPTNWQLAANQFSLSNWPPEETSFTAELAAYSKPVFAANFYNRPPRLK
jgi:hypothetical protein